MFQRIMTTAAGLAFGVTALLAQMTVTTSGGFQQAGTLVGPTPVQPLMVAFTARTVTNAPFSGTEERHTTQTLSDGTVLDTSETAVLYRDSEGRTRTERTVQGRTTIIINDPATQSGVRLDPATKTAWKSGGTVHMATQVTTDYKASYEAGVAAAMAAGGGGGGRGGFQPLPTTATTTPGDAKVALDNMKKVMAETEARQAASAQTKSEDLGLINQNGVPAQGTRTTLTIPVGQIGNNREIKVVNERWYSQELQMTVKSINSDPRFGTTTYEVKNISRLNPDASLFQIPGDYTVQEGGRGRGAATTAPAGGR
jgi:hypothetical protein